MHPDSRLFDVKRKKKNVANTNASEFRRQNEVCSKRYFCYQVDVLVNNAGMAQFRKFPDGALEDDKTLFDANVFGAVSLTRHLLRHLAKTGRQCHVAVTSSMAGISGTNDHLDCLLQSVRVHAFP